MSRKLESYCDGTLVDQNEKMQKIINLFHVTGSFLYPLQTTVFGVLILSGSTERNQWHEIGQ